MESFIHYLGLRKIRVLDDWGGPLAAHYAVHHAQNVEGLALMETFRWPIRII